jgi:tetratricopeptide (TPR) repeat protein
MALRDQYFDKAAKYIEIWLRENPKPTPEGRMFYTSLLYNQAILDPENIDMELLKKAQEQVHEALVTALNPKESFYVILMATLQQEERHQESAEILELLVKQYPSKKPYWQQLMNTYSTMAAQSKSEDDAREHNLRAILTIERAQAMGHMTTPKDNYNLVGIYFNIKQFDTATRLLHKGLQDGSIESDQQKWELLAYSFQQIHKEFQAIDVLKEASQLFPNAGQLDNQIAQIYYAMNKVPETYRHLTLALAKGGLTHPADVYYFKAYICYELLKYEEALVAVEKAAELGDGSNERLPQLRSAISASLAQRQAALEAKKSSSK